MTINFICIFSMKKISFHIKKWIKTNNLTFNNIQSLIIKKKLMVEILNDIQLFLDLSEIQVYSYFK